MVFWENRPQKMRTLLQAKSTEASNQMTLFLKIGCGATVCTALLDMDSTYQIWKWINIHIGKKNEGYFISKTHSNKA